MGRMRIIFITFLMAQCFFLQAFDWPVKDPDIVSSFGEQEQGSFNTGIYIQGAGEEVVPIADGQIIFFHDRESSYSSLPRGLGNFVVAHHEGNIRSVYGHLADVPDEYNLSVNKPFAMIDKEKTETLFFQILDVEENLFLNPMKKLTPPLADRYKPEIKKVFLLRDGRLSEMTDRQKVTSGEAEILVQTKDLWKKRILRRLGAYKIICSQNGREAAVLTFNSMGEKDNRLVLTEVNKSFDEVYRQPDLINLGSIFLIEGRNHLQITVILIEGAKPLQRAGKERKRPGQGMLFAPEIQPGHVEHHGQGGTADHQRENNVEIR